MAPAAATLLLRDVAAAMLHLHSEGVIHGDLKAANVRAAMAGQLLALQSDAARVCWEGGLPATFLAALTDG